jgi:hypothetical protein
MIRINSASTVLGMVLQVALIAALALLSATLGLALIHPDPPPATRAERAVDVLSERVTAVSSRVTAQAERVTAWTTETTLLIDAVSGAQGDIRTPYLRSDQQRCAGIYTAEIVGKRRQLSTGKWGLKGAPTGANWSAWPADWDRCAICAEGYECAPELRGSE